MALRSDADAFWARCVELAAYWTVHPKIDDAERATLPANCQRVKLAHFRFPSVYRFDERVEGGRPIVIVLVFVGRHGLLLKVNQKNRQGGCLLL